MPHSCVMGMLTEDQILDAAQEVLRRFGPDKTAVVDVARELGVSHGTIYRTYPTKAALREAVMARWLLGMAVPLARIADETGPAGERLGRWILELASVRRRRARSDPDMFALFRKLAEAGSTAVHEHEQALLGQLTRVLAHGAATADFRIGEPGTTAVAVLDAMARFHHPAHAASWEDPGTDAALEAVWHLL